MYLQQPTYTQPELQDFAKQLNQLQELITFFQQQASQGSPADPEPILKLMNALVDLYS